MNLPSTSDVKFWSPATYKKPAIHKAFCYANLAKSPTRFPEDPYDWTITNCTLISSLELISELETRLARKKFEKYLTEVRRFEVVERLSAVAELVSLTGSITACRDPDDDKVLEAAVVGRADCIVSGDGDLLVLDPFRCIPILSPAAFLMAAVDTSNS